MADHLDVRMTVDEVSLVVTLLNELPLGRVRTDVAMFRDRLARRLNDYKQARAKKQQPPPAPPPAPPADPDKKSGSKAPPPPAPKKGRKRL